MSKDRAARLFRGDPEAMHKMVLRRRAATAARHDARIEELTRERDKAEARIAALEAEVARLREALKDVIEAWDWWQKDECDRDRSVVHDAIDAARTA